MPTQFRFVADVEPSFLQVDVFDQQVHQFARTQPGLSQRDVDGERPVVRLLHESQFGVCIEYVDRLCVLNSPTIATKACEGIVKIRRHKTFLRCKAVD